MPKPNSSQLKKAPSLVEKRKDPNNKLKKQQNKKRLFLNNYMCEIIKESKEDDKNNKYYCRICPTKPEFNQRSVYRHILECETHQNFASSNEHEELKKLIQEKIEKNKARKNPKSEENIANTKHYLEFLAFCMKQNFSFEQISSLGKFLKNMSERRALNFFQNHGFDDEEISKMANCFGDSLIEQLKNDLAQSPFSLTLDNVTLAGKSICGLQVRYLKQYTTEENVFKTCIENRIVGIKHLEESSTGEALYQVVKEKLLDFSPEISTNLKGMVHDHASNLTGMNIGVGALLRKDLDHFFMDLKDPCHSLNLILVKAIKTLPKRIMKFIKKIHKHFSWPQRRAFLAKIQRENQFKILAPIHYIETRWLSLGFSLRRILQIWDSLIQYMKAEPKFFGVKLKTYGYFIKLLEDKVFQLQITCLANIIDKINGVNIRFQDQRMEIQNLKYEMNKFLREIMDLYIIPTEIPDDTRDLREKEWQDMEIQKKNFSKTDDFLSKVSLELDYRLIDTEQLSSEEKEEFARIFQEFLAQVLHYSINYLPFDEKTIDTLDFVTLNHKPQILKEKILNFNKIFNIIPPNEVKDLCEEINALISSNIDWARIKSQESTLHLWDLIESSSSKNDMGINKYDLLSRILKTAHALPTSSACIEQSFSTLKLVKKAIRSNLEEKTTQSLILIAQEFGEKPIAITEKMLNLYHQAKEALNKRK